MIAWCEVAQRDVESTKVDYFSKMPHPNYFIPVIVEKIATKKVNVTALLMTVTKH